MNARRALTAGILGFGLVFLAACVLDVPYKKYAIVYGVADYLYLGDLTYPDEDADAMAALLSGQGYTVTLRKDGAAIKAQLQTDLDSMRSLTEDDLFLLYFSGHGGPVGTGPEPAGGNPADEVIALHDSKFPPELATSFGDDDLNAVLRLIPCRKKVVIIDACNSGGFINNTLEVDGTPPTLYQPGDSLRERVGKALTLYANFGDDSADIPPWEALVISASGERELSYENGYPYQHGVFTYYLLQTESQGDTNGDGSVTVTEAFDYASRMISRDWNSANGLAGAAFSPRVSGGPVDYVLFEAR